MPHPSSHAGPVPAPAVPCPAGTGEQQSVTALSGPGLGVPVSIWPHTPVPGRGSGPDAAQIITAFSRPGELVVIPGARDGVLVAAAAAAGRRVLGLPSGPRSRQRVLAGLGGLDPRLRPLAEVRPGGPALLLEAGNPDAGQAALAITGSGEPVPPCPGEPAADPGVLYAACQRVLRPGGVLAVITASTPDPGGLRDDPGEVIAGPAPPGSSTPSTSSPCTPPSPAASSPPLPGTPPVRARWLASRPFTPAPTATSLSHPAWRNPAMTVPPPPARSPARPRQRPPGP